MKYSVNFYLEKRLNITENVRIFLYFSFEGQRLQYYTGHRVDSIKWDTERQRVKKNNINSKGITAAEINDDLNKIDSAVVSVYKGLKAMELEPTVKAIRDQLKDKLIDDKIKTATKPKEIPFLTEFDNYIEVARVSHSPLYIKQLKSTKQHIENFSKAKHFPLSYSGIDLSFFERFKSYFLVDLGNTDNSFAGTMKRFKGFMKYATGHRTKGKNFEYVNFSATEKYKSPVVHLTWAEFQTLAGKKIENAHMLKVRDLFIFQSMTGMRFDDMHRLKKENLKAGYIEYVQHKTGEPIRIPYNTYSLEVRNKYLNTHLYRPLPYITNQEYNRDLKKLFKYAGLKREVEVIKIRGGKQEREFKPLYKLATSHMARRNFIGLLLEKRVQTEIIKEMSGHNKNSRAFSRYYSIDNSQKVKAMKVFNK